MFLEIVQTNKKQVFSSCKAKLIFKLLLTTIKKSSYLALSITLDLRGGWPLPAASFGGLGNGEHIDEKLLDADALEDMELFRKRLLPPFPPLPLPPP